MLAVLFAPLAATLGRLERARRPGAGIAAAGPRAPSLLLLGIALAVLALSRFAVAGFDPGGQLPVTAIIAFAAGLALIFARGHRPGTRTS